MKYIFITGGVVSSLGKGLISASLGYLLEERGLTVLLQKFDPYLNVDPGTMSPYQHGEVYVLEDGQETDLDLGHYERFTHSKLTHLNSLTSGQVFESVIDKERQGIYLGKTVQFIPHVTDEIQDRLVKVTEKNPHVDVLITEIGGTVGDIEAHLFLEALRQFSLKRASEDTLFIHTTLLPYLKSADEVKTKPTQQSVAKLREIGIQPDIIVCRSETPLADEERQKIGMFCNTRSKYVIEFQDLENSIYEGPLALHKEKLDESVVELMQLNSHPPNLKKWESFVQKVISPKHQVIIGIVGKYTQLQDAYKSIDEAFIHAGAALETRVILKKIDAEKLEKNSLESTLGKLDGILIPGGFGSRGIEGKILAAQVARENNLPYFGICLGMQIAVIEFSRHVCGLADANSTEINPQTAHPVICLQEEQATIKSVGASMRLGNYSALILPKTHAHHCYEKADEIHERHRHRYEFNADYREKIESAGLVVAGVSKQAGLIEIVELTEHPFYIGVQFHPEFKSKPNQAHPLFLGFVKAALNNASKNAC